MFHREVLAAQDLQVGLRLVGLFLGSEFLNFHLLHCEHPSFVVDVLLHGELSFAAAAVESAHISI